MRAAIAATVLVALGSARGAALPPAPPQAGYPLAVDLNYPDAGTAQKAWRPMRGSAQVEPLKVGGRPVLRMPCNFRGTTIERASWDVAVKLDLTTCRGLQFAFFCRDATPVSGFSFYLHSGGGWYAARFGQRRKDGWSIVRIETNDTRIEGTPAGWSQVDTLRISAWRGRDVDTEFHIANLGLLGADAPIAIIRGESVGKTSRSEAQAVSTYTKAVAESLEHLGLDYTVISDLDVTVERLKGKQIAILPHNPAMPDNVADALVQFLQGGGKLLSFYTLPERLRKVVGVKGWQHIPQTYRGHFATIRATEHALAGQPAVVKQMSWNIRHAEPVEGRSRVAAWWFNDKGESTGEAAILVSANAVHMTHVLLSDDRANKHRLVLAMLGHLAPELWQRAAEARMERVGRLDRFESFADALAGIRAHARGDPRAGNALRKAEALHAKARALLGTKQWPQAIEAAEQADEATLLAYCGAQKPQPGEHRAWWCHSAFGVAGTTWDQAIKNLADNGFTAILPNMSWGGTAYYHSKVLPVAPEVKDKGDQIALCLAACRKHGIQCHVWRVNWNMSHRAPKAFVERMRRERRTQVSFQGKAKATWLCPSHPANQQLEVDAMIEVATQYEVDGIHFDYIRYPGPEYCFCDGCRKRFEEIIGQKVANWPADVRRDQALREKWLDFRRRNITAVVAKVSEAVRQRRPKVKVSAAVFRNAILDSDRVGQDWRLWCERGYLDFVCPMDYTPHLGQFDSLVEQQRQWAGRVPCYPGIGVSVWGAERDVVRLIDMIRVTRRLGTGGFTIFNYAVPEATRVVPLCGHGITRKQ